MTGGTFTDAARTLIAQAPNPTIEKPFDRDHLEAVLFRIASEQHPQKGRLDGGWRLKL